MSKVIRYSRNIALIVNKLNTVYVVLATYLLITTIYIIMPQPSAVSFVTNGFYFMIY